MRCGRGVAPWESVQASPAIQAESPGSTALHGSDGATRTGTGDVAAGSGRTWSPPVAAARRIVDDAGRRFMSAFTMEQFLGGNWRGALMTVATGFGAMVAVALVAVLLAGAGAAGARAVIAISFAAVASAFGGSVHASGFGQDEMGTLEVMPLTLTLIGLGLIGWRFLRSLPGGPTETRTEIVLQAARTALVFLGVLLVVGILGRYTITQGDAGLGGESELGGIAVSVPSTMFSGLFWFMVTLAVAVTVARPGALPPRLRRIRGRLGTAVIPVAWLVGIAFIAGVLAGLIGVANSNAPAQAFGVVLLVAPNLAFASLLLAFGIPAEGYISGETSLFGGALPGANQSVTVLTLTDYNATWWLLPLAAAAVLLGGAFVAASHARTRDDVRPVAFWLGLALAVALLLMAITTGVTASVATSLPLAGSIAVHFDGVLAFILGAVWGLLAGFIAVTARLSRLPSAGSGRAPAAPPPQATLPGPLIPPWEATSAAERPSQAAATGSDATYRQVPTRPGEQPGKPATSTSMPPAAQTGDGSGCPVPDAESTPQRRLGDVGEGKN